VFPLAPFGAAPGAGIRATYPPPEPDDAASEEDPLAGPAPDAGVLFVGRGVDSGRDPPAPTPRIRLVAFQASSDAPVADLLVDGAGAERHGFGSVRDMHGAGLGCKFETDGNERQTGGNSMNRRSAMTRATMLAAVTAGALLCAASLDANARPDERKSDMKTSGVHDFQVRTIDGKERSLRDYRDKVLLIVNTASRCGFTSQYASLETLYGRYRDRGFEVLAFPANDFLNQEPGSDEEIRSFCALRYQTSFPLFSKIRVKGKDMAPLYDYLTTRSPFPGAIGWNFTKFLVGRDGRVVGRFDSKTDPLDRKVTDALETALEVQQPASSRAVEGRP
jgi:glutathione peroxidase